MSDGVVFCLEYLTEQWMLNDRGGFELARLTKYQLLDYQDGYLLSIGEKGQSGFYHKLEIEEEKSKGSNFLSRVKLDLMAEFKVDHVKKAVVSL